MGFVSEIMWLIYIGRILWSSNRFMGALINPKALLSARYLAAFVLTLWPGRLQFKGSHLVRHWQCS